MTTNEERKSAGARRKQGWLSWGIKLMVFPFRFAWLLIVWARLRSQARKAI